MSEVFAQPNHVLVQYHSALVASIKRAKNEDNRDLQLQELIVTCLLAVSVVEVFFNLYFRILVLQPQFAQYEETLVKDLTKRVSLKYKIDNWPKRMFGASIGDADGVGLDFKHLRDLRNRLMHFTSSHQTIEWGDVKMVGMANIEVIHELSISDAVHWYETVYRMMSAVFRLRGLNEEQARQGVDIWVPGFSI